MYCDLWHSKKIVSAETIWRNTVGRVMLWQKLNVAVAFHSGLLYILGLKQSGYGKDISHLSLRDYYDIRRITIKRWTNQYNKRNQIKIVGLLKESNWKRACYCCLHVCLVPFNSTFWFMYSVKVQKFLNGACVPLRLEPPNFAHSLKTPFSSIPSKTYHNLKWIRPFPG